MPSTPLSPESSLGYQANYLARLMENALREQISPVGVVPGQFAQLLTLYESDGLTQTQLCERVRIEQPTMANTLARMQRDGLIDRTPDPRDGRRSLVTLTEHAHAIEGDLVAAALRVNAAASRGLSADQIAQFMQTMAAIIANLDGSASSSQRPAEEDAP
jgi:DNA-binding MarR family transcriptional regulator